MDSQAHAVGERMNGADDHAFAVVDDGRCRMHQFDGVALTSKTPGQVAPTGGHAKGDGLVAFEVIDHAGCAMPFKVARTRDKAHSLPVDAVGHQRLVGQLAADPHREVDAVMNQVGEPVLKPDFPAQGSMPLPELS